MDLASGACNQRDETCSDPTPFTLNIMRKATLEYTTIKILQQYLFDHIVLITQITLVIFS